LDGKKIPQVAPGSRRQDHTTSPSAASVLVRHASMPDATASIASCTLRIVTIAKRPSVGTGRGGYAPDFDFCKAEYFSFKGLTRFCKTELICPSRQFVAGRFVTSLSSTAGVSPP
jgi:hypothetical protein